MKKLLLALLLALPTPAWATDSFGHVVASCGTQTYKVGNSGPMTVLATGELCSSGGGGGGGNTTTTSTAAAPTYSEGVTTNAVSSDLSGNLRVIAPANASTNIAQVNGGTVATGSGVMNSQTQRMALATDSPGIVVLGQAGMASSVPVVQASNQSVQASVGAGATGAAVPANAVYMGVNSGGNLVGVTTGNGATSAATQRVAIGDIGTGEYENVAASATAQALGPTGATGDYLLQVVCTPTTTSPGVVTILDNATTWTGGSFPGGASSVSNLLPFTIPVNAYSTSGAWKLTTGANISCTGVGNFT